MVFNSLPFAVFFVVVYGLYVLTMRRLRLQNIILLIASYFFYGWWDWRFLALLGFTTCVDYAAALALDWRKGATAGPEKAYRYSPGARRAILLASLVANLGVLGFFKYFNFFAASAAQMLSSAGLGVHPFVLNVILPVGVSFYTFQSLSYTIDVYRGEIRSVRSLIDFALFVAFFPQLVAGPIVRASDFLPQVIRPRRLDLDQIYEGGYLILWGLFKKVFIADGLARMVEQTFGASGGQSDGGAALVGIYAFAVQIYCDFSGYTDVARGCAKLMGFEFQLNFNLPYMATNPVEFWHRWHISLSTWLRDYLYIPLGGSRRGTRRTYVNLMITMTLGGLWHGAAWTFVLWGVYHGMLLAVYRAAQPVIARFDALVRPRLGGLLPWAYRIFFFHLVCFGWLLFRADSMTQVASMVKAICSPWPWWILVGANSLRATGFFMLCGYSLPLILVECAQHYRTDLNVILRMPVWARGLAYTAMFYGIVLYGSRLGQPFIYFQF
jgi:alginate O-acetyltransferase complex protein AlgI